MAGRIRLSEFGGVTNGSGLEGIIKSALDALDEGGTLIFDAIRYSGNTIPGFEYAIYQPIVVDKSVFIQADSPEIRFVNKSQAEEIFRVRPNKDDFFIGFEGLKFISGTKAITISGSYRLAPNSRIQNLNFWHQTNRSLEVQVPEINLHIEKVHFKSNSIGAYFESHTNHDNLSVEKCKFEGNSSIGFHFVKSNVGGISGSVYVTDTEFISNNQALIVDNVRYYEHQVEYNLNQANFVLSGASMRLTGSGAGGGSGVTDHGALTGLLDDDHPQYLLASGSRPMGGNLNMGGYNITNPGTVDGRDVGIDGAALDAHIIDYNNPHQTSLANIGSGTLAQLNAKISDADLPTLSSFNALSTSFQQFTSSTNVFTASLNIPISGSPTVVTSLTSAYNAFWSAGSIVGFNLTDNGNGTVDIGAGEAMLRSAANHSATLYSVSVPATSSLVMTNNSPNYIFVDWNNGTPIISTSNSTTGFNCLDKCLLWSVTREGSLLYSVDGRSMNVDSNSKHRRVLLEAEVFKKATYGSVIGNPSGRYISLTSGTFFYALNRITHESYDTSVAGTANQNVFKYYYRNGSGGWLSATLQKEIDNSFYDDGTGVTASLGVAKYRTDYAYLLFDGAGIASQLAVVLGQNESNSAADAEVYPTPSSLPVAIQGAGTLLGQIVVRQGASTLSSVKSAYDTVFRPVLITSHNNLSDLQGGGTGEYYHLTLAQTGYVSSFPSFTASVNSTTASLKTDLYSLTSSFNSFTSSVDLPSLLYQTATFIEQITGLTASVTDLYNFSSSMNGDLGYIRYDIQTVFTSTFGLTASVTELYAASSSFRNQIIVLQNASSTFRTELNSLTNSVVRLDAASATFRAELNALNASTASYNNLSSSFLSFSQSHKERHMSGGADFLNAQDLAAFNVPENHFLISNGAGGWTTVHSATVGISGSGGVSEHGLLTGLGHNDHPHYVLTSTFGAFTASVNATTASLQSFSATMLAASATFATNIESLTSSVVRLDSASGTFRTELTALTSSVTRLDAASGTFRTELTSLTSTVTRLDAASATFNSHISQVSGAHGISTFGGTLIDDNDAAAARTTLGLGDSATRNVGTTPGTVAAGDDPRLSGLATPPPSSGFIQGSVATSATWLKFLVNDDGEIMTDDYYQIVHENDLSGTDVPHKKYTYRSGGVHSFKAFSYGSLGGRLTASGLTSEDVGKIARQAGPVSYYILDTTSSWIEITNTEIIIPGFTSSVLSTTSINDYNPAGWSSNALHYIQHTATVVSASISGMVSGSDGRHLYILSTGSTSMSRINILHNTASSAAANRFMLPEGQSFNIPRGSGAKFLYNNSLQKWISTQGGSALLNSVGSSSGTCAAGNDSRFAKNGLTYFDVWHEMNPHRTSTLHMDPFIMAVIGTGVFQNASYAITDSMADGTNLPLTIRNNGVTANSGARLYTENLNLVCFSGLYQNTYSAVARMQMAVVSAAPTVRWGFHDATNFNDAVDGLYIEFSAGVFKGKSSTNSVRSTTATTFTPTVGTWYVLSIDCDGFDSVTFTIQNPLNDLDGWSDFLALSTPDNIPELIARAFGVTFIGTNSAGSAANICAVSYLGFGSTNAAIVKQTG